MDGRDDPGESPLRPQAPRLVVLCAADAEELARRARDEAAAVGPGTLSDLSARGAAAYDPAAQVRATLIAAGAEQLQRRLLGLAERLARAPGEDFELPDGTACTRARPAGKVALLFPGLGSEALGMGAALARSFAAAHEPWEEAAGLPLDPELRLPEVVFPDGEAEREQARARLRSPEWGQPALGCASLAYLRLCERLELRPAMVAGHSFGELTALHAAGALELGPFLQLARRSATLVAAATPGPCAMLALGEPIERVRELLARLAPDVSVANHNHPRQVVLSGAASRIEALRQALSEEGLGAMRLEAPTAFHSPRVEPARDPFAQLLAEVEFRSPRLPVYSNARAAPYSDSPAALRDGLVEQITSPVRFLEMIEAMYAAGARTFVEVGPGAVLSGFVERILAGRPHTVVPLDRQLPAGPALLRGLLGSVSAASSPPAGIEPFLRGLARLVLAGVPLNLAALLREQLEAPSLPGPEAESALRAESLPHEPGASEQLPAVLALVLEEAARALELAGPDRVAPERSFRELGFDSLMELGLRSRLRVTLGTELPPATDLAGTTPLELAALLSVRLDEGAAIRAIDSDRSGPAQADVFPARQRQLWLWMQLPTPFGSQMSLAYRVQVPRAPQRLREALEQLVARHPALRTGFRFVKGRLGRFVASEAPLRLEVLQPDGTPLDELVAAQHRRSLPLDRPPLWHLAYVTTSEEEVTLLLTVHHIVFDGSSAVVFADDLCALLAGRILPELVELPPARPSREPEQSSEPEQRRRLRWWRETLAGTTWPRPKFRWRFEWEHHRIPLKGPAEGPALGTFLLAGLFLRAWADLSGDEQPLIGMLYSGRSIPELRPRIGYLGNLLPVRLDRLDGSPAELAARTSRAFERAVDHELPVSYVVSQLAPELYASPVLPMRAAFNRLPPRLATNVRRDAGPAGDATLEQVASLATGGAPHDLVTYIHAATPAGVEVAYRFDALQISREEIKRLHQLYAAAVQDALADP